MVVAAFIVLMVAALIALIVLMVKERTKVIKRMVKKEEGAGQEGRTARMK